MLHTDGGAVYMTDEWTAACAEFREGLGAYIEWHGAASRRRR